MNRIDLAKEHRSFRDVLTLAKSEAALMHSPLGEDFVVEAADEFDREVAALLEQMRRRESVAKASENPVE